MYRLFLVLLLVSSALFTQGAAMAGEDVTVTIGAPAVEVPPVPYDGYKIYYIDSTGDQFEVFTDFDNPIVIVPDVPFGPSQWWATSLCSNCQIKESENSQVVDFIVESKTIPKPPGITISITITVN